MPFVECINPYDLPDMNRSIHITTEWVGATLLATFLLPGCATTQPVYVTEKEALAIANDQITARKEDKIHAAMERAREAYSEAYDSGDYDRAYDLIMALHEETITLENTTAIAMLWLALVEGHRDNSEEMMKWLTYSALAGNENAVEFLGNIAPIEIGFGEPLLSSDVCDLFLDSIRVLPDNLAIRLRITARSEKWWEVPFVVNAAYDANGGDAELIGGRRGNSYYMGGVNRAKWLAILPGDSKDFRFSYTCGGVTRVAAFRLDGPRIIWAQRSFFEKRNQQLSQSPSSIPMEKSSGVYEIPVTINGVLTIRFVIDSGAAEVFLARDVATTLMRTGTISEEDFLPDGLYTLADGSVQKLPRVLLRSVRIGDRELQNVTCAISENISSPMLLGQSVLEKLGKYTVDYSTESISFE